MTKSRVTWCVPGLWNSLTQPARSVRVRSRHTWCWRTLILQWNQRRQLQLIDTHLQSWLPSWERPRSAVFEWTWNAEPGHLAVHTTMALILSAPDHTHVGYSRCQHFSEMRKITKIIWHLLNDTTKKCVKYWHHLAQEPLSVEQLV
jgi:hypothetical protein